jgi:hypothetical protein
MDSDGSAAPASSVPGAAAPPPNPPTTEPPAAASARPSVATLVSSNRDRASVLIAELAGHSSAHEQHGKLTAETGLCPQILMHIILTWSEGHKTDDKKEGKAEGKEKGEKEAEEKGKEEKENKEKDEKKDKKDKDDKKDKEKEKDEKKDKKEKDGGSEFKDHRGDELGLQPPPKGYGATYLEHDWKMKSVAHLDDPIALKAGAWQHIVRANSLLHGFVKNENGSLSRARYPAFELMAKVDERGAKTSNRIPDFEVFDRASISVHETSSELTTSMASNGFSSQSIDAALSGKAGWFSAAASGGFAKEDSTGLSQGKFQDRKDYTATYSVSAEIPVPERKAENQQFPRARVFLDEATLQLTKACADDLNLIRGAGIRAQLYRAKVPTGKDGNAAAGDAQRLVDRFNLKYGMFARCQRRGLNIRQTAHGLCV